MPSNIYFNPSEASQTSANAVPAVPKETATQLAEQTFALATFKSEIDKTPCRCTHTWTSFTKQMEKQKHSTRKTKQGTGTFSPVSYSVGAKRGNAGVESITMAVLDVDSGVAPDKVKTLLNGYAYVIHSTWSHTAESPSYRVIVPFTSPVAKANWSDTWARLNYFMGGINDEATKDPARMYYLPSHPEGSNDFFVEIGVGKFLNPDDLPALPVPAVALPPQPSVNQEQELGTAQQMAQVQQQCQFVQWASNPANQPKVSEPLWNSLISNLCRFEGGQEAIHAASCHYPEYDENKTDAKTERALENSGPITCAKIREYGFTGCPAGGCKTTSGKVTKAPAGLGCWQPVQLSEKKKPTIKDHVNNIVAMFDGHLQYLNSEPYSYRDGHWPMLNETVDVAKLIAHYLGDGVSKSKLNEILTLVQTFQAVSEQAITPNLNLICLNNGTLDTQTGALLAHDPSHNLKTRISCDWNPKATCERWLQFLDEIFANDPDKAEKIQFLQEWFGYCLTPDISQHKFVWMVGSGGNGKSVLLEILVQLIGTASVSNAHIERLADKHVRAELEGKLVNISSEMSAEATISDSHLKAIVAGDYIEAERKFKPSFSFKPIVKMIGATNNLPRLLDLTDGFFRRAIILKFNRQFSETERDPDLVAKLKLELSGILAWAVGGLLNLRARGRFDIPASSVEALTEYRTESDPERMFLDECLAVDLSGDGMSPQDIYEGYVTWCRASGFRSKSKVNFGKRLGDLGVQSSRGHRGKTWRVKRNDDMTNVWGSQFRSPTMPIALAEVAPVYSL